MSFVRSFTGFYPPRRFDDLPFTQAAIEESAEEGDGYSTIETIMLDPVDSDPTDPQSRDFTTAKATLDPAWYRIAWEDASGGVFNSDPIFYVQAELFEPDPALSLVEALRRMTAVGVAQYEIDERAYWSDEDLEAVLGGRECAQLVQAEIELIPSVAEDSHLVFLNGRVRVPGVLDVNSAKVVSYTGKPIKGATVYDDGRIDFATSQATTVPLLSGNAYDLNGAAADVLTDWAAAVQLGYDISLNKGQMLKRSQRHEQLLQQAEAFRARAVAGTVHMTRSDVVTRGRRTPRTSAVLKSFERWGVYQ